MMSQPAFSPDDILSFAVAMERTLRGLYGSVSQDVAEPDLKEALRRLANDELGHEKLLLSHCPSLGVSSPPPPATDYWPLLLPILQKGRETTRWATSPADAMRIALALEVRGEQFYASWAKKTTDHDAKRTLDFLTTEEIRHAAILKTRYHSLTGQEPQILPEYINLIPWPDI